MINAIETEYKGYKFRSRLEARWAVFFDAANVKYEYETEGFQFEFGDKKYRYLPDFYLPDYDIWVEVKPSITKLMEDSEKIALAIDYGNTQISHSHGLMILGQIPWRDDYESDFCIPSFPLLYWEKGVCSTLARFVMNDNLQIFDSINSPIGVASAPDFPKLLCPEDLYLFMGMVAFYKDGIRWEISDISKYDSFIRLRDCFTKARQARFEHGEKGCT